VCWTAPHPTPLFPRAESQVRDVYHRNTLGMKTNFRQSPPNNGPSSVCVIDSDVSVCEALASFLRTEGMHVETFNSARQFLSRANPQTPGCVVMDVNLPGMSGLELQQELARTGMRSPIIFLAAHDDLRLCVRAIKAGAVGFMAKPVDPDEMLDAIQTEMLAYARTALLSEHAAPCSQTIVGASRANHLLLQQIALVAPTDSTVLIQGETGTGKELIAHEIHKVSRRKEYPLVKVNCASIPRELYESEFFGHMRGAFTGAIKDRIGRFEAAHGGTLFLDEIGEVPLELQSKLLRALQEKQFERVGDERTRRADVRIVAATNRDLKREVEAGRFRRDLYYRLSVFPVDAVPLRERPEDIPLLARHFVGILTRELKCTKPRLTDAGVARLQNYDWPGNIRELRNVIERACIVAQGKALEFDLPLTINTTVPTPAPFEPKETHTPEFLTEPEIQRRARENLCAVLQKTNWKIKGADGAAELLGIKPTTLISRIKKMGLKRQDPARDLAMQT
jgi:DNA-binding NtrC family response regulator